MSAERPSPDPLADGLTVWRRDASPAQNRRCWGFISDKSAGNFRLDAPKRRYRCRHPGAEVEGADGFWCRYHRDQAVPADDT